MDDNSRIVIFSDLHIGNGKRLDDFKKNAGLFIWVLNRYRQLGYSLILNGDIEELQRYRLREIQESWPDLFWLFDRFQDSGRLMKVVGNHDLALFGIPRKGINRDLLHASD